jgi:hypothetical protein
MIVMSAAESVGLGLGMGDVWTSGEEAAQALVVIPSSDLHMRFSFAVLSLGARIQSPSVPSLTPVTLGSSLSRRATSIPASRCLSGSAAE